MAEMQNFPKYIDIKIVGAKYTSYYKNFALEIKEDVKEFQTNEEKQYRVRKNI
jgi:heterodisulfide reductase subunit A-like polyferredoxin